MKYKMLVSIFVGLLLSLGTVQIRSLSDSICEGCLDLANGDNPIYDKGFPLKFVEESKVLSDGSSEENKLESHIEIVSQTDIGKFVLNWLLWSVFVFVAILILGVATSALSMVAATVLATLLVAAYFGFIIYS